MSGGIFQRDLSALRAVESKSSNKRTDMRNVKLTLTRVRTGTGFGSNTNNLSKKPSQRELELLELTQKDIAPVFGGVEERNRHKILNEDGFLRVLIGPHDDPERDELRKHTHGVCMYLKRMYSEEVYNIHFLPIIMEMRRIKDYTSEIFFLFAAMFLELPILRYYLPEDAVSAQKEEVLPEERVIDYTAFYHTFHETVIPLMNRVMLAKFMWEGEDGKLRDPICHIIEEIITDYVARCW